MELYLPIANVEIMAWQLVLLGLTVGIIGGFFGIGGAFIITPALNIFGFPMSYAIGTDMAHIVGKSIVATATHRKLGNVDMKLGILMVVFTAIGIETGAIVIMWLERIGSVEPIVRIVYIVLLFGLGIYMLYEYFNLTNGVSGHKVKDAGTSSLAKKMQNIHIAPMIHLKVSGLKISLWVIGVVATSTGFLAGFLGVGGGFIRMPALMYVIGCPTTIAVGTDLFEIMISGLYGAFTYAYKGRVDLIAAVVMLFGAAIGAQIGTLATAYVKGLTIRLYFAVTMILAGVSVVFKYIASNYNYTYKTALNSWVT
ncbi:MAG: sulfite exporter TauE/SafE family protein, partial [Candidatus Poribacteria bacterium]